MTSGAHPVPVRWVRSSKWERKTGVEERTCLANTVLLIKI